MKVELRFREARNGDYIAYLQPAGAGPDGGVAVRSIDEFDDIIRGALGASNRSREIHISSSEESLRGIALLAREERGAEAVMIKLADGIHALGLTSFVGSYDDGMPIIYDLREHGAPLNLEGDFPEENQINCLVQDGDLELIEVTAEEPVPAM